MSSMPADPLHEDLVAMLAAVRGAERALFGQLDDEQMTTPMPDDAWSPQDLLGHLAAWRAVEARRLGAVAAGAAASGDDPAPDQPVDEANARLQAERAGRARSEIEAEADESVSALVYAIGRSSHEALCECDDQAAGIGANGINHAIGHLGDVARLVGDEPTYARFAATVEEVLQHGHLPPRDSGVLLYNLACHAVLSDDRDGGRRLLRRAFARRPDLLEWAMTDPDVAALRSELSALARRTGEPA
jgi:hypothetical protein